VAVAWTLAFAAAAGVHLPFWLPAAVGLSAWSLYIGDRLLDARAALTPLRPRHHFHWRHRRVFLPLALAAGLITLILVLRNMPPAARIRDSVLAAAALAYFTSVHNPWRLANPGFKLTLKLPLKLPKEFLVALIFTLACALPTWARVPGGRLTPLVAVLTFVALAWLNCQAIETWESGGPDAGRDRPVRGNGIRGTPVFVLAAWLAGFALAAAVWLAARPAGMALGVALLETTAAGSAVLLAVLDLRKHRLAPTTLRALADLVLLTPLLVLAVAAA